MSKRILLVAATTGYQTRVFEDTARRLGLDVALGIDRCLHLEGSWGEHAIALRFEDPTGAAELLAQIEPPPDGVVAVGDRPTEIAALAAAALKLPFHSHDAVLVCRNKFLQRERFRDAGLRVPEYFFMPAHVEAAETARRVRYPCVVKPLGLSGSRGVIRANHESDLREALGRIRDLLDTPEVRGAREERNESILVEDYIPGREFAVEGIVTDGHLQPLAIFDKPDPLEGPFFEETIYVTPSREKPEVQAALVEATRAGVRALGLTHGPIHAEMRYNEQGVWLLEIAARPIGGLCADSLRFDSRAVDEGVTNPASLQELILRHAVGENITNFEREASASGVMMIPIPLNGIYTSVSGVEEAAATPFVHDVIITAQPGQRLLKLPEGASYLGFIFARGPAPAQVENALRTAHAALRFEIATELPLMRRMPTGTN